MGYHKQEKNNTAMKPSGKTMTVQDVVDLPCLAIEERGITLKTAKHFRIRTELDSSDGVTPVAHYFPYTENRELVAWKRIDLILPKGARGRITTIGSQGVKNDLCGTVSGRKSGGGKVFITEGEYDMAISWQALKDYLPSVKHTVLSISNGTANAVQNIGQKQNMKYLDKFDEVVSVFDNDRATSEEKEKGIMKGNEATAAVYGLIPELMVAQLPIDQDPCDVYNNGSGIENELLWMLYKPIRYTPEGFISFNDVRTKALELPKLGKPWPWESATRKTLGRRKGEGIYFGSGVKMGKSLLADKVINHITTTETNCMGDPQKVAVFKFEEQPDETLKKIAGKFYKKDFSNPEKVIFINEDGSEQDVWGQPIFDKSSFFTAEELEEAIDSVGPQIILYNNYGRCHWDELKGAIRHAVLVEHVEDIFIDPITRLTAGMSAAKANEELERFSDEISKMSQDLGFTYYCFCHLKAPVAPQKPHEAGGRVYSSQFRGSRAMMQACHYMIGLEGDKSPEASPKVQNTRYFVILDDRKHGRTARIPLFYDEDTGDFIEPPKGFLEAEDCDTLKEWYELHPEGLKPKGGLI